MIPDLYLSWSRVSFSSLPTSRVIIESNRIVVLICRSSKFFSVVVTFSFWYFSNSCIISKLIEYRGRCLISSISWSPKGGFFFNIWMKMSNYMNITCYKTLQFWYRKGINYLITKWINILSTFVLTISISRGLDIRILSKSVFLAFTSWVDKTLPIPLNCLLTKGEFSHNLAWKHFPNMTAFFMAE